MNSSIAINERVYNFYEFLYDQFGHDGFQIRDYKRGTIRGNTECPLARLLQAKYYFSPGSQEEHWVPWCIFSGYHPQRTEESGVFLHKSYILSTTLIFYAASPIFYQQVLYFFNKSYILRNKPFISLTSLIFCATSYIFPSDVAVYLSNKYFCPQWRTISKHCGCAYLENSSPLSYMNFHQLCHLLNLQNQSLCSLEAHERAREHLKTAQRRQ